jgi:hypothetical protein
MEQILALQPGQGFRSYQAVYCQDQGDRFRISRTSLGGRRNGLDATGVATKDRLDAK